MQDTSTGDLVPLHGPAFEAFKQAIPTMEFKGAFDELQAKEKLLRAAMDEAIPNRDHQGPVFHIGEVLEIKGGKFRVNGFSQKRLYLDSIPS